MYRKASSTSVPSGVPSGTYTGGERVIDGAPRASHARAARSVAVDAREPCPIAYERPASHASSVPCGASSARRWASRPRFCDRLREPRQRLGVAAVVVARDLLGSPTYARRRSCRSSVVAALFGGGARGALRPGRYLFPLDAVEIALPDASGQQLVTVRPLGDARHADVELDGKRVDLVLGFEGGEVMRFTLRGDHKGTVALRRLEHAQKLLEDLTYKHRLEDAFANDLFFDLRVDNAWSALRQRGPPRPPRAPNVLSLALSRFAPRSWRS